MQYVRCIRRAVNVRSVIGAGVLLVMALPPWSTGSVNEGAFKQSLTQLKVEESYGKLPLSFEANRGQTDERVNFLARGPGYSLFLTSGEAVLALDGSAVRMRLVGANPQPQVSGREQLPGVINYFTGDDSTKWQTNVPTFARVQYQGVYPGVNLIYYGNQGQLEYDFVIAPGVDPNVIALDFEGADALEVSDEGDLVLYTANEEIQMHKPVVYQEVKGVRREISGGYVLKSDHQVGFQFGAYDPARTLVIDPVLSYSTYLGGSQGDWGNDIAVDASGDTYVTGWTRSPDFPPQNPLDPNLSGSRDAFVTKLDVTGQTLIYSTYLGGDDDDFGEDIVIDANGNVYVTGGTASTNFPTQNPLQANHGGGTNDAFVAKLDTNGTKLVYSTYLGGEGKDVAYGIAVDGAGNAHVTGETNSRNLRTTRNAFQSTLAGGTNQTDAFVATLDLAGTTLVYSTYFGGGWIDKGQDVAVDTRGNIYVVGWANSRSDFKFPTTTNAFQRSGGGGTNWDAYVAKFVPSQFGIASLAYSTLLGGSGDEFDEKMGIAVDSQGAVYVTGWTNSPDFPTKNPLDAILGGPWDAYVAKFDTSKSGFASLIYSTYLGGSNIDNGNDIAVDEEGNAYVTGFTRSNDLTLVNPVQSNLKGRQDAFVVKLNVAGAVLVYATYLGGQIPTSEESEEVGEDGGYGIAVDPEGCASVTGWTRTNDFPTANPLQPAISVPLDAFVTKICDQ